MTQTFGSGLPLSNIPHINLLQEFQLWDKWIHSEQRQFASSNRELIRTPLLIWGGMPEDLLTLILQRTVLGLDSYVSAAVWMKLGESGRLTPELNRLARNPFEIRPRQKGTANCYYNALPALIDPTYALKEKNAALWKKVKEFYTTVRNKILHGYQISSSNPAVLYPFFDMLWEIYAWVNEWHPRVTQQGKHMVFRFGHSK